MGSKRSGKQAQCSEKLCFAIKACLSFVLSLESLFTFLAPLAGSRGRLCSFQVFQDLGIQKVDPEMVRSDSKVDRLHPDQPGHPKGHRARHDLPDHLTGHRRTWSRTLQQMSGKSRTIWMQAWSVSSKRSRFRVQPGPFSCFRSLL